LKISNEVKTAIFVILSSILFIIGYGFLKGSSFFNTHKTIYSIYNEVEGLVIGANVTINGMIVGKVTSIDFSDDYKGVQIGYTIPSELSLSKESKAVLYESGLIGGKAISIEALFSNSHIIEEGSFLKSKIKPGLTELINQQITPLQNKIERMLTSADSLFAGVSNVMNYETQDNLKKSLNNLSKSIQNINNLSNSMSKIISSNQTVINSTFKNIEKSSKNLSQITDSLALANISPMINNFNKIGKELGLILEKIQNNEGSLGNIINNQTLYQNLVSSSKALEDLIIDLNLNPKKYVHFSLFGKSEKKLNKKN
jgi:phospholipid/cholesterol/gamma-HCH transport system substrate-binding protein